MNQDFGSSATFLSLRSSAAEKSKSPSVAEQFSGFLGNLVIKNISQISVRYGEITAALNKRFRDTESKTANSLQVGSFGRRTGIDGISDLDMLYLMPKGKWADYESGGQSKLLKDVKDAILKRYPSTNVRVDRLVVTVTYTNFHVEVQPAFEQEDGSFKYPDTKNGGSWKITKPRAEMDEVSRVDTDKNGNLKCLCKMTRAWKNKHGVGMGGLLIDTLAYNFLTSTSAYDTASFSSYDTLSRNFFDYLANLPKQDRYDAPGSRQHVKVKTPFQRKAKKARKLCDEAIAAEGQKNSGKKWRKVYGNQFPVGTPSSKDAESKSMAANASWNDTEEWIEDRYPVDIRYDLKIDCTVTQNGFRAQALRAMLAKHFPLLAGKSLAFHVEHLGVPGDYELYWKVLNRGDEAKHRNQVRGQIVKDTGSHSISESTDFMGDHVVECYAVKDGVVVAKDRIHVPIQNNKA
ncbi:nucleotide-binding domain-containing protein [Rosistilla oblonga]|uniref:nucleotide-binding domain-containing protein n=2 Tax=Pseudomonadati TaxID=3379134 RepID=UPI003A987506